MASKNFGKAYETDKKRHKTETHLFTYSINKTKMTCEEFRKNLIELCDKDVNPELRAAMKQHMDTCDTCRTEYDEYMAVVNLLRPNNSPVALSTEKSDAPRTQCCTTNTVQDLPATRRRPTWLQMAAAILLFIAGVCTGWSHFFSTDASANESTEHTLNQAIAGLRNVGNFVADFRARTKRSENFAYLNPNEDFVHLRMTVLRENGTTLWRVEKENGRTVIYDGQQQAMWYGEHFRVVENADANLLEGFTPLLQPETILESLEKSLRREAQSTSKFSENDSTFVLTATVPELQGFSIDNSLTGKTAYTLEYTFNKANGLPIHIRIWTQRGDNRTLVLESESIRYNISLDRQTLTALPKGQTKWIRTDPPQVKQKNRLTLLQKETAIEAARRITEALSNSDTLSAREALQPYRQFVTRLIEAKAGCKMTDFRESDTPANYPGTWVTFTETHPNGTTHSCTLALRRDNPQRIWVVDGGL